MTQSLTYLRETASQTAGPFVHIGLMPSAAGLQVFEHEIGHDIVGPNAKGNRIRVEGAVYDGTGSPIRDALIEAWQANADGIYPSPGDPRFDQLENGFRGWGRASSNIESGDWSFETIKPGPVPGRLGNPMAPHINLWIIARGINVGLSTRLYFDDEDAANQNDPVLRLIEQKHRRATLMARRGTDQETPVYRFDIHVQGVNETVFFDI